MLDPAPLRIDWKVGRLSPLAAEISRMRAMNDALLLWRLCDQAACRRARHCHGDFSTCFAEKKKFVPPAVRAWYVEMLKVECDGSGLVSTSGRGRRIASAVNAWRAALSAAQACETRWRRRLGAMRNAARS